MTVEAIEASVVNAARPWPGLDAFTEVLSPFFFGRDTEANELMRRVRRDLVTLLFGQSGLGKTSLLQAGLFPRLRKERFLPIPIRIDYQAGALSPVTQVKAAIERECTTAELSQAIPIGAKESLWGCFHRVDRRFANDDGEEIVPVLVFDQFEEVFTQGLAGDESRAASQSFLTELADLAENRPPDALERAIEADPDLVEAFLFDRRDYRIVLVLREDFLATLESLRSRVPSLGRNRYRLRRMTGQQGLDAILKPVPGLVGYEVAQEIIRFIGRASPEDAFGISAAGDAVEGFEVEPALLSLVCRELNERRLARGLDQIGADLLAGNRENIIARFYERCLEDQPAALRHFVEDRLLSDSGFRESINFDSALRILSDSGVPAAVLDQLVRRRLLRIEQQLDVPRVEIIHDVLTPVIRNSRDTRRLRQAEAAAAERGEELRRARRRVRRAQWLATTMALLVLVTVALAWWGWSSRVEAERQRAVADEQRAFAEQQRQLAEEQRAAAAAESKRAEHVAVTTADTLVTTVAPQLRNLSGVSASRIREILGSAERAFDEIAATAPNSQHLRWRRAVMLSSFADTYLILGDSSEALRRAKGGSDIMRSLVEEDATNDEWQADFADSHRATGDALCGGAGTCGGDLSGALTEYHNDLDIMAQLNQRDPENFDWQAKLAVAHASIGLVLSAQGDRTHAVAEYRAYLGIALWLAEKAPSKAEWQHKIIGGHLRIGDLLRDQGDLDEALAEVHAALDIARRLADEDPNNTRWQPDLSLSYARVAQVLLDQGDLGAALMNYRTALDIQQRLVEKDPGNTVWQRDLSVYHLRVGDVLYRQGDSTAALVTYRTALDIQQRLVEKDPGNAVWQHDLSASYTNIGLVAPSPVTGTLVLDVTPSGAMLTLDGNQIGPAKDFHQELPPGLHVIEISANGYTTARQTVKIAAGKTMHVPLQLAQIPRVPPPPTKGSLVLEVTPPGAILTLDGTAIGPANGFHQELPAGSHVIEISADGYTATKRTITIVAGETLRVPLQLAQIPRLPPPPTKGTVALEVRPSGAMLTLDGKALGPANGFHQELPAGSHTIEISADGYQSRHEVVTVPAGGEKSVEFALVALPPPPPATGTLELEVSPPAAILAIDGARIGSANGFRRELPAGSHRIDISAPGYQGISRTLNILAGKVTPMRFDLTAALVQPPPRPRAPSQTVPVQAPLPPGILPPVVSTPVPPTYSAPASRPAPPPAGPRLSLPPP